MRTWAKGTTRAALLTASFVALGAGTAFPGGAYADTTSGDSSVLGGNQINLPISAPIDASGNAGAVGGVSHAGSKGGASVTNGGGGGGQTTSGKHSVGGGNQVNAPISAPINACGNAVAIFGTADAGCKGGASVTNSGGGGGQKTSGKSSVLGGNQVNAPISAPINACGNAVAIFGSAEAGCKGGASVTNSGSGGRQTNGDYSVGGGNQVHAPISAPVNVCGNAAAIFGEAVAGCEGGAKVKNGGHTGSGQKTSGKSSVLGGNQVNAPISAPIDVCGNAVGNAAADCDGGASVRNGGHGSGGQKTSGEYGVLAGNQVNAPVSVPVSACGNAVAVLGEAGAFCEGGAHARSSSGGDQTTSGKSGVGSGNQVNAPVNAPVNICGNAVAVLGSAAAGCTGTAVVEGSSGSGATTSGQSGVGSGNQVNAPVKAPIDVCANVVAVAGHIDPECGGDGPSYGGYQEVSRNGRALPGPVTNGLLGLPTLPDVTKALPANPSSALPALPALAALPKLPQLPVQAPAAPSTGALPKAPALNARDAQAAQAPAPVPALPSLPIVGALPIDAGMLPVNPGALPVNPGALPVNPGALPVNPGALPVNPGSLPVAAPGAETLPALPVALPGQRSRTQTAAPAPAALPDLPELPVVSEAALPRLPVTTNVKPPQVGGPAAALTEAATGAGRHAEAAKSQLAGAGPVAADEPLSAGSGTQSLWVLGAAALLMALSGALAATRRFRLGRR